MQKTVLVLGAILFFLGLVSGLLAGIAANPRMGLSAHMQGITNGIFLIAVGAAWHFVSLSDRFKKLMLGLLVYGTYANWLSTQGAAFWNTGNLTPIHSSSPTASSLQEAIVSFGLVSLTVAMLLGTMLLVWGFLRSEP